MNTNYTNNLYSFKYDYIWYIFSLKKFQKFNYNNLINEIRNMKIFLF